MSAISVFRRWPLRITLVVVALFAVLEIGAYVLIVILGKNYYLPLALDDLSKGMIPDDMRAGFSAEFGWTSEGSGPDNAGATTDDVALAVFGDEYSADQPDYAEPWPEQLERRLGQPVVNGAVGGYGLGQAYLRYDHWTADKGEAPYVALVSMSGTSARLVNRYRGFYARRTDLQYPKPMFKKTAEGDIELLPNPVRTADELVKLADPDFIETIGEDDYWYAYYDAYGLNHQVAFPYSVRLAKAVPYYVTRFLNHSLRNQQSYKSVYRDDDATDVFRQVVETFFDQAKDQGSVPIFVIIPNYADMADYLDKGATSYAAFFQELQAIGHTHIYDGLSFFLPALEEGADLERFYISESNDMLTPEAKQMVADSMHRLLTTIDAEQKHLKPSVTTSQATR